jgi:selenocysteine-specific elongation factor
LQILDLLKIQTGIIVINKIDLADPDWLNLVEEDVRAKVKGTILRDAPVVRVSSTEKTGMDKLFQEIVAMIARLRPRMDVGKPRIYIDRVFTMAGRGTVITGTLRDGQFKLGEEVEVLPQGIHARIRELQSHKKIHKEAGPGTRVAMNLAGVEKEKLQRGNVIVRPGQDETTETFVARLDVVSTVKHPVKHNAELLVILGTTEMRSKARLLDKDQIMPGDSGFVQFMCKGDLLARIGDHFIARLPSPQVTVGGGIVLDIDSGILKRKDDRLIPDLRTKSSLQPSDLILSELSKRGLVSRKAVLKSANLSDQQILSTLSQLEKEGRILVKGDFVADLAQWNSAAEKIVAEIEQTHKTSPFKIGARLAGLSARLKLEENLLNHVVEQLVAERKVLQQGAYLSLPAHRPTLSSQQMSISEEILQKFAASPLTPPTKDEIHELGSDYELVMAFLIEQGKLVELKDGVLFTDRGFEQIRTKVVDFLRRNGQATVSQLREHLGTTRKYMVPILEKLDQSGVTQREDDKRTLAER